MHDIKYARAGGGVYWHLVIDGKAVCGFEPSGKRAGTRGAWARARYDAPLPALIHPDCVADREGAK